MKTLLRNCGVAVPISNAAPDSASPRTGNIKSLSFRNLPSSTAARQEIETTARDMELSGYFRLTQGNHGPYNIILSTQDRYFVIAVESLNGHNLSTLALSLNPYKKLIQDYFLVIDSYEKSRSESTLEKLEAIDMARRGLHNEGATLFMDRLKDKADMDFETARRFFTLLCAFARMEFR